MEEEMSHSNYIDQLLARQEALLKHELPKIVQLMLDEEVGEAAKSVRTLAAKLSSQRAGIAVWYSRGRTMSVAYRLGGDLPDPEEVKEAPLNDVMATEQSFRLPWPKQPNNLSAKDMVTQALQGRGFRIRTILDGVEYWEPTR